MCRSLLANSTNRIFQFRLNHHTLTTGAFDVQRVTLGANIDLWHQSLLMVNYERWILPVPNHRTADVFGVRYTITF